MLVLRLGDHRREHCIELPWLAKVRLTCNIRLHSEELGFVLIDLFVS